MLTYIGDDNADRHNGGAELHNRGTYKKHMNDE